MRFRKVVLQVIVQDEDAESLLKILETSMARIEKQVTVIWSDLDIETVGETLEMHEVRPSLS